MLPPMISARLPLALLVALAFAAPAARAQMDCAQCLAVCKKDQGGENTYPDEDEAPGIGVDVRHNDPQAKLHFLEAQRADPAFGGTDLSGALKGYRAAVRVDPTNAQYRNFLAAALMRARNPSEAIYNLEQAVHLVPNEPKYLVNLGYAHHKTGDEVRALVQYQRALMLDPRDLRARLFAGYAMTMLGLKQDAILEMKRVLAQDPSHEAARRALRKLQPPLPPQR